jgi:hypothetical protein
MKKQWILVFTLFITLFMGCSKDPLYISEGQGDLKSAKKPAPNLIGITQEFFSPSSYPFIWVGTIDFSENEAFGSYKFAYELLEMTQKDFANAGFFTESFYVYEGSNPLDGTVYLKGTNSGVLVGGMKFTSNGWVEIASGPFEGWEGRKVHVSGEVVVFDDETGAPLELSSTFRIN